MLALPKYIHWSIALHLTRHDVVRFGLSSKCLCQHLLQCDEFWVLKYQQDFGTLPDQSTAKISISDQPLPELFRFLKVTCSLQNVELKQCASILSIFLFVIMGMKFSYIQNSKLSFLTLKSCQMA